MKSQAILKRSLQTFTSNFLSKDIQFSGRLVISAPSLTVIVLAMIVNFIEASGGAFVYYPESGNYVAAAYSLLYEGSLKEVGPFLNPGYIIFLAPILGFFGKHAILVLVGVQHAMMATVSYFVVQIGNEMDRSRWLGLVAGILSAFSLQLHSVARIPMTETLYIFIVIPGLWMTLRYLRTAGVVPFAIAAFLFSVSALVGPIIGSGKLMPVLFMSLPLAQALFPRWRFLFFRSEIIARDKSAKLFAMAAAIYLAVVSPWMLRNLHVHDYFGINPEIGISLFAKVIESQNIVDENSSATNDIRKRWHEREAARIARGEQPQYDWRHSSIALDHYMQATGKNRMEADKVFFRAALDAIKANPKAYVRLVLRSIYRSFTGAEASLFYVPGIEQGRRPPWHMPHALPPAANEASRQTLYNVAVVYIKRSGGNPTADNPFVWREPTVMTPIFGAMMSAYHAIHAHGNLILMTFLFGLFFTVYLMVRRNSVQWLVVLVFYIYTAVFPFLVVSASARYRMPGDPITDIIIALALIKGARALVSFYGRTYQRFPY